MCAVLLEMGLRRKKSLHAVEQDPERGKEKRSAWKERLAGISAERFVFLDGSGVTTDMTRPAWANCGDGQPCRAQSAGRR